jgi:hypothetical protein
VGSGIESHVSVPTQRMFDVVQFDQELGIQKAKSATLFQRQDAALVRGCFHGLGRCGMLPGKSPVRWSRTIQRTRRIPAEVVRDQQQPLVPWTPGQGDATASCHHRLLIESGK